MSICCKTRLLMKSLSLFPTLSVCLCQSCSEITELSTLSSPSIFIQSFSTGHQKVAFCMYSKMWTTENFTSDNLVNETTSHAYHTTLFSAAVLFSTRICGFLSVIQCSINALVSVCSKTSCKVVSAMIRTFAAFATMPAIMTLQICSFCSAVP